MTTSKDHIDKSIELLLQYAYSSNKGLRWRRKQLGLVACDIQDERFRQCLLSNYLSLKAYLLVAKSLSQTNAPNQHRKRENDGQWANRIQRSNPHTIAYLYTVAWDVSINLRRNLQRGSYGIVTKATPKPTTGVNKIKGLSVMEDTAYAQAMYTATYLFTLDYSNVPRLLITTGGLPMIRSRSGRRGRHVPGSTQQRRRERSGT
jgi:hypothetical protein